MASLSSPVRVAERSCAKELSATFRGKAKSGFAKSEDAADIIFTIARTKATNTVLV